MTKIIYYYQNKEQKKLDKLVKNPLFEKISLYLLDHQGEEIILRELKKVFINEKQFEQFLEEMIRFGLVNREERRYSLNFPLFQQSELQIKPLELASQLKESLKSQTPAEQVRFYGDILWEILFSNEEDYFFGINETASPSFYERVEAGNGQLTFVSVHKKEAVPLNLAAYFDTMTVTSGDGLPFVYQPLQELIGDVDSEYFAAQAYRIVRAVLKKRKIADKRNIFLESLVVTNDLTRTEDGWVLQVPIITEENPPLTVSLSVYTDKFQQIIDKNQRLLKKRLFYQTCLELYLENQDYLTYYKYN
ncbi:DUF1803 domain-containing protein [Enterococcus sp. BWB1-3]|uniref:DUF1803 domain-containing protein n=1 Tax=Enterococcus sp. BWB1-3 TaxID=2787713 RepID=UPI001923ABA3|nr:DUF1803 domain-containing protein [Enterococcus sp. BWB1-3]MBL1230716.1 DUF1803 domain-containing protein [Enterococcus sp. BWB1-3]